MDSTELILVVFGTLTFFALGSFICVVIDRLPVRLEEPNRFGELWDTRPWSEVLGGNSRCSSCGDPVSPIHNVPVLSWLWLRGRCKSCGSQIPAFHPAVELLSPALFMVAVLLIGVQWKLVPVLVLIPFGLAIATIDFRTLIVPTRLVWPGLAATALTAVIVSVIEGEWLWIRSAVIGLLVMAGPLFVVWFIYPRGMGFGDVRLATLIGFNLGFYAGTRLQAPVYLAILGMALAALLGLFIGVVALGARGRKAQIPFGPSMLASAFICIVLASQILSPFGL